MRRKGALGRRAGAWGAGGALVLLLVLSSCMPKAPAGAGGGVQLTVYGFSVMKESLDKAIFPGFAAKWQREHGQEVKFVSSFAGSETVVNQILQGVGADIAILSIDRDATRLKQGGAVTSDWHGLPLKASVTRRPSTSFFPRATRKAITNSANLAKPGVNLIPPTPLV